MPALTDHQSKNKSLNFSRRNFTDAKKKANPILWVILNADLQNNGCWKWNKSKTAGGYGVVQFEGTQTTAHRVVYTLLVAPFPKEKVLCHKCDNPWCVNPEHLFIGTTLDNQRDSKAKGRTRGGAKRKLDHGQILSDIEKVGIQATARLHDCATSSIHYIINKATKGLV